MAAKEAQKRSASPPRSPAISAENQKRLFQSLFFMSNADATLIRGIVEKLPNRWTEYPEFLAWGIIAKKKPVVEFLLSDGATLDDPPSSLAPDTIGLSTEVSEALRTYRKKPYLVLAACTSSYEVVDLLLERGADVRSVGHVGLSKTRLNSVASNVLGAAVFNGRVDVVEGLLSRFPTDVLDREFRTIEEKSIQKSKSGLSKEYSGCTPLLLAVHRTDSPEMLQVLLNANCSLLPLDWQGNSALHIAVSLHKPELIKVIMERQGVSVFARNSKGETPASIAKDKGFSDLLDLLGVGQGDSSDQAAAKLLDSLTEEEEKKLKKKHKKSKAKAQVPVQIVENEESKETMAETSNRKVLKIAQLPPYPKDKKKPVSTHEETAEIPAKKPEKTVTPQPDTQTLVSDTVPEVSRTSEPAVSKETDSVQKSISAGSQLTELKPVLPDPFSPLRETLQAVSKKRDFEDLERAELVALQTALQTTLDRVSVQLQHLA